MSENVTMFMIFLFSLAVIVLVGYFVIFELKALFNDILRKWREASKPTSARGILNQRYARGELTREEYKNVLDDIKRSSDA